MWFHLLCTNKCLKHSQAVELEKIIREILYPAQILFLWIKPRWRMQMKVCVHVCVCACVCASSFFTTMCVRACTSVGHRCQCSKDNLHWACRCVSSVCSWRILFKRPSRLCLPCHYNYKGHLTLNLTVWVPLKHMASVSPLAKWLDASA